MAIYPNQRTVKIDKPKKTPFCAYGKEDMATACKVLNGSAFKVWCYLLSNNDGTFWDISPAAAEKNWGIHRSTFLDGIRELKEKGFIVESVMHQKSTLPEEQLIKPERKKTTDEFRITSYTNFDHSDELQHSNNNSANSTSINNGSYIASSDIAPNPTEGNFYF